MTRHEFMMAVCVIGLIFAVILAVTGCATQERFMSQEQDDEFRAKCQAGCVVLPNSLWMQILQALQGARI